MIVIASLLFRLAFVFIRLIEPAVYFYLPHILCSNCLHISTFDDSISVRPVRHTELNKMDFPLHLTTE